MTKPWVAPPERGGEPLSLFGVPSERILLTLTLAGVLAGILMPRWAPLTMALVGGAAIVGNVMRGVGAGRWLRIEPVTVSLLVLAALAFASQFWAAVETEASIKALLLVALTLVANVFVTSLGRTTGAELRAVTRGLVAAMIAAGAILAFEAFTVRLIERSVFSLQPEQVLTAHKHVRFENGVVTWVSEAEANRRNAVFFLLLIPAFAALYVERARAFARPAAVALGLISLVLAVFTEHQSSQSAVIVAAAVLGLAWLLPKLVRPAVTLGWVALVTLCVPLALMAFNADIHRSDSLFSTAQQRIVIWSYTAEKWLERPILGVGASATKVLHEARPDSELELQPGMPYPLATSRHAHNYYVQIYYELGVVGAAVLLVAGLAALLQVSRLGPGIGTAGFAQFTAVAMMVASSYGLWQFWLHCAIALSACLIALAEDLRRRE